MNRSRLQLEQVKASLAIDPQNEKLLALKGKLEQLIDLQSSLHRDGNGVKLIKGHSVEANLQIGESCEVLDKGGVTWQAATVLSLAPSRDFYIVALEGRHETVRVATSNVRRPTPKPQKETKSLAMKAPKPAGVQKYQRRPKQESAEEAKKRSEWQKFKAKIDKK